jgi:hypothetical protein
MHIALHLSSSIEQFNEYDLFGISLLDLDDVVTDSEIDDLIDELMVDCNIEEEDFTDLNQRPVLQQL